MRCRARRAGAEEWAELLEAEGGDHSLSQRYQFGEALARAYAEYSYEPRVLEFDDGLTALLPLIRVRRRPGFLRCYEAMPFSLNGAPVTRGGCLGPEHWRAALRVLNPDSLLLSGAATQPAAWAGSLASAGFSVRGATSHLLDLSVGLDAIWRRSFSGKVRNQCRVAERKGVEVRSAQGVEDFDTYFLLYQESAARWGYAATPYPRSLFRCLAPLVGQGVELKLAFVGERPVAGVLLLHGRRSTLYWGAAMLREYASHCPNNALLRAAIEEACRRGLSFFDLGSSGRLSSVEKYKESFGARPVHYHNLGYRTWRYRLAENLKGALRRAQAG